MSQQGATAGGKIKEFTFTVSEDVTVREIDLRVFVFRDVLCVKRARDIFKPVRETHRTYCNVFQRCMSHKINHISKWPTTPP